MVTPLTSQDLREFAEAGGWKHMPSFGNGQWRPPRGRPVRALPDFIALENLHLCVEVAKRALITQDGGFSLGFWGDGLVACRKGAKFCEEAKSPNEAIIRAVLALRRAR